MDDIPHHSRARAHVCSQRYQQRETSSPEGKRNRARRGGRGAGSGERRTSRADISIRATLFRASFSAGTKHFQTSMPKSPPPPASWLAEPFSFARTNFPANRRLTHTRARVPPPSLPLSVSLCLVNARDCTGGGGGGEKKRKPKRGGGKNESRNRADMRIDYVKPAGMIHRRRRGKFNRQEKRKSKPRPRRERHPARCNTSFADIRFWIARRLTITASSEK